MRNLNNIKKYFIIILGFAFLAWYIWIRFLRHRIPRVLPLTLLVVTFFLILCSIVFYIYMIFRLFKPAIKENKIITELSNFFYLPLEEFDSFLKLYFFLDDFLLYIYKNIKNLPKLYFFTNLFPRIITSLYLILDVFLFFKFYYVYKVIFITLIPLLARYYIYSLKKLLEQKISVLAGELASVSTDYVYGVHPDEWPENQSEDDDDDFIGAHTDDMCLPLKIFIPHQTRCIVYNKKTPIYMIIFSPDFYRKCEKDMIAKKKLDLRNSIEELLTISIFIMRYKNLCLENKWLRNLKAFLYAIYLVSWSYIIFYTAPHVLWYTGLISLLRTLYSLEDPFSGCEIFADLIEHLWD